MSISGKPLVVGIGGTTRTGSSGERIVRCILSEVEARGGRTRMFGGAELAALPHYAPEMPHRTPEQLEFLEAVRAADGFIIGTPAYHGGISGLVKNALDLLEDLRDDGRCYFSDRAVGLVVVAAGWQACGVTLQSLRGIVHAMRGWPTPLGITVNTIEQRAFGENGEVADPAIRNACIIQAEQVLQFANNMACRREKVGG